MFMIWSGWGEFQYLVPGEEPHTVTIEYVPQADEAVIGSRSNVVGIGMKLHTLEAINLFIIPVYY